MHVTNKAKKCGIEERYSKIKVQPNASKINNSVRNIYE